MSVIPGTIRANPDLWKEDMKAEVLAICREGLGLPYKVTGFNHAVQYFGSKAHRKEGWKFLEGKDDTLQDVLKFLTSLVNPVKPARVTGKLATTVVECLFLDKKVSWAKVLEEVMAQQVKLMGPRNVKVCLSGYLAPIYAAKQVLTRKEGQDYRLTQDGGDPEANKEVEEESEQETET
jgi:hypothetical protein